MKKGRGHAEKSLSKRSKRKNMGFRMGGVGATTGKKSERGKQIWAAEMVSFEMEGAPSHLRNVSKKAIVGQKKGRERCNGKERERHQILRPEKTRGEEKQSNVLADGEKTQINGFEQLGNKVQGPCRKNKAARGQGWEHREKEKGDRNKMGLRQFHLQRKERGTGERTTNGRN